MIPLYGFVEGDTMGVLVLAAPDMTLAEVAETLAQSAALRVDSSGPWELIIDGHAVCGEVTVNTAGLRPLGRVDLRRRKNGG